MKYALKSVPGWGDVGVPHGDGQAPQSYTQMSVAVRNNVSNDLFDYAEFFFAWKLLQNRSLLYRMLGFPMGMALRAPPWCLEGSGNVSIDLYPTEYFKYNMLRNQALV